METLEANGFIRLQVRVDGQGYFVAVEPGEGEVNRLLQAILSTDAWRWFEFE